MVKIEQVNRRFMENRFVMEGRIKVNSISKIRKIMAMRKNWIEKGKRADLIGSNPHSKGEGFSRSLNSFFANRILTKIRAREIILIIGIIMII